MNVADKVRVYSIARDAWVAAVYEGPDPDHEGRLIVVTEHDGVRRSVSPLLVKGGDPC